MNDKNILKPLLKTREKIELCLKSKYTEESDLTNALNSIELITANTEVRIKASFIVESARNGEMSEPISVDTDYATFCEEI